MSSTIASELEPKPERGSTAICVPVSVADGRALATINGVVEHSDPAVPILLAGSSEPIAEIVGELAGLGEDRTLCLVAQDGGAVAAVNEAMRFSAPADVALVAPGCLVGSEWLERLREAAMSDSIVASASALSIGGGGVELLAAGSRTQSGSSSAGADDVRLAPMADLGTTGVAGAEQVAAQVRTSALRLRPRIAGRRHAVWARRPNTRVRWGGAEQGRSSSGWSA